jgi:hypothetical protein
MTVLLFVFNLVKEFEHFFLFVVRLCRGNREELVVLYRLFNGPNAAQLVTCSQSSIVAKQKFRPTRMVQTDGSSRLAEPGERGGTLYNTVAAGIKDMGEVSLSSLLLHMI